MLHYVHGFLEQVVHKPVQVETRMMQLKSLKVLINSVKNKKI